MGVLAARQSFVMHKAIAKPVEYKKRFVSKRGDNIIYMSVDEIEYESLFKIYPNPSECGYSTILLTLKSESDVFINILNLQGKVVQSIENKYLEIGDHVYFVNAEKLEPGIYLVNYCVASKLLTKKLNVIKQY